MDFHGTQRKSIRVLRWIVFLPAAFLGALLLGVFVGDSLTGAAATDFAAFALLLFLYAVQGAAFVFAGAAVAPDRQREIGWWLAALLCAYALIAAFRDTYDQYILTLAVIVAKPAGGLLAAFLFRRPSSRPLL
jgi:hypothetical protein